MKQCTKCKQDKNFSEFSKNRTTKDGYEYWCSECRRKFYGKRVKDDISDLVGKRFGKLVTIEPTKERQNNHVVWLCKCDCGNTHKVIGAVLKLGISKSCGCWRKERLTKHGGKHTRLYNSWKQMRMRCNNPKGSKYHIWGGKGISICEDWNEFGRFKEWALKNGYNNNLQIHRLNNDLGYSPDNCEWLTVSKHSFKTWEHRHK